MIKATVTKLLNRRIGSPSVNAPKLTPIQPGESIKIKLTLTGDDIGGNDCWYQTNEGYYVWSGGVEVLKQNINIFNYRQIISNLDSNWINTGGADTLICIVDTGIVINKQYFNPSLVSQIDLVKSNIDDGDFHGNFICGIIASIDNSINGISANANVTSIRYKDSNSDLYSIFDNLSLALETIKDIHEKRNNLPVIVNFSQGFTQYQTGIKPAAIKKINELIIELSKKNVFIVCAAGENNELTDNNLLFPAFLNETISIGCISKEYENLNFSKSVDIIMPFVPFKSFDNKFQVTNDSGSSFATAILSGVISSIISYNKKNGRQIISKSDIINELRRFSVKISEFKYDKLEKFQICIPQK